MIRARYAFRCGVCQIQRRAGTLLEWRGKDRPPTCGPCVAKRTQRPPRRTERAPRRWWMEN